MKGLKKGLGIYLILFFAMFCGIIWYMNKNSKTDSGYTIRPVINISKVTSTRATAL